MPTNIAITSPLAVGLRVARAISGMSDVTLAERAQVGRNTIRRAEAGLTVPHAAQLHRIAEALAGEGADRC